MISKPQLEQRPAQSYLAVRSRGPMSDLPTRIPQGMEASFAWLSSQGITQAGPPFVRYLVVDMENDLEIEVGLPVAGPIPNDGRFTTGILPAGRYATLIHTGPYEALEAATGDLLAWATAHDIRWQTSQVGNDEVWAARLEYYLTDPGAEPDPAKWETELAFLTAE